MRAELSALHHRLQATMIYVTHDQVEAMTMGDRIVVLKDGLIQQIGTPLGLYNTPVNRFVAGFIGSPPMNFMKVGLKMENGKMMADEGSFRLELTAQQAETLRSYAGKDAIFGIRPEDLEYIESPDRTNNIPTKVEVVEPLGAEIHLWVSTKNNQIVARVPPRHMFQVGEDAHLRPDLSKIHFFDIETEKAIF
jgi:multiple sugar transport system ATP-binding protein